MSDSQQGPVTRKSSGFVPWQRDGAEKDGQETSYSSYFQVRYKRRYLLLMSLLMFGMAWMGTGIIDKDMTEMFLVMAPMVIVPATIRFFGVILALMLAVLIPAVLYFTVPDLADLLGKAITILMFLVFFPLVGLAWAFALFDQRPQLLIGPDGICCRQFSEELIPWDDITFVHVSTYERLWFLKVEHLIISLRDFSCYPKPSSVRTPQYLFYSVSRIVKKPHDSGSITLSGFVFDPSLPFVMKAIETHRSRPPQRKCRS